MRFIDDIHTILDGGGSVLGGEYTRGEKEKERSREGDHPSLFLWVRVTLGLHGMVWYGV